jgi:hypothetical protein
MIIFIKPNDEVIRYIQEKEGVYYWSLMAEKLFRANGLISTFSYFLEDFSDDENKQYTSAVLLRGCNEADDPAQYGQVVWETPNQETFSRLACGRSLETVNVERALLRDAGKRSIGQIFRQRIRARTDGRDLINYRSKDDRWNNDKFEIQLWPSEIGEVLAWLDTAEHGEIPAIIRLDSEIVLTFPLFDIFGQWLGFPPMDMRYAGIEGGRAPIQTLLFCQELIEHSHSDRELWPIVKALPFPKPFRSALSIRHDYDRKIDEESWKELLDYYEEKDISASFSILTYLMPERVLNLIEQYGHEIQLHCFAHTESELREQIYKLAARSEQPIDGVTIHGGPSGVGFRGDIHNSFFERSRFSYAEGYGMRDMTITPLARLVDGIPRPTERLVAPPFHFSLDGSTRPEDHRLEQLKRDLPLQLNEGRYIVLMNHPDIHREALYSLLDSLDLSNCWTPTTRDAVSFATETRLNSTAIISSDTAKINIGRKLRYDAEFKIIHGPERNSTSFTISAGDVTSTAQSWRA